MTKKGIDNIDFIIELCLFVVGIMGTLLYFIPVIESSGIIYQFFTSIIFGIGGIGIGSILVRLYIKLRPKHKSRK